ncbi:restriction endonuclease subunit S [Aliarcobacter butzleri]|uniref:restriction endonuclease subunit S n=1 Tax=Aliarcobacter butzleri TaxID=28197 RepID=UPI002B251180|nr:restriction endonuclease subunit S [Aliarcobacter butzleri]
MSSWRECKLWDVAEVKGGKRLPKGELLTTEKTPHPYIRITDFDGHKINLSAIQYVTEEVQKSISRYIVNKQDIIISNVGTIGLCAKIPDELDNANLTENCVKLVFDKNKIDTNFLYYHLISPDTQELINSLDVGSTQPKLPIYNIQKIDISLPPLEEQKAIAEVLCSFDDKIDLLHRQNQTLESLAQTLFRQWFIEEAKEEWEEVTLSDVMELKYGKDHKHLNDGKIPIYGSGGIMRYGNTAIYENESILIPRKGTLSNIFYVDEPFWTVDTIFWSKINSEKISGKLLFEFLKTLNFSNMNVGSAVPSLTTKVLNEISFALPSLEEQEEFKQYTDNAWDKVKQNKKQIQTLENLRDTLLPKLLSGEVRVKI